MAKKENVLMPAYAENFHCIGGTCENTCCKEWDIGIEKKTYKKYITCSDFVMREKLKQSLEPFENPLFVAKIKIDEETLLCPFLNTEKMCELQLKFGEGFLSKTCSSYPRQSTAIDNSFELVLSPSCPEVVRKGFLSKEPMRFTHADADIILNSAINNKSSKDIERFHTVREFLIGIMQDRRYMFELRMILAGMFIQKLTQNNFKHISETISTIKHMMNDRSVAEQFFQLPEMPDFQFSVIIQTISLARGISNQPEYLKLMDTTLKGINFYPDVPLKEKALSYFDALIEYEKIYKDWEHVFENYMVNYIFSDPFPFFDVNKLTLQKSTEELWKIYMNYCITYRMLKFHFVGINKARRLNNDEVVNIISNFHRAIFGHNSMLINSMSFWFESNNFNTLAYMSVLVRT